ncbi:guanine nucleotide exchange factor MSS4-like isoform X2 [Limulus polyphemus]|nr:guanine nucleotide exchange factor MSS4-like isoform X2 [Limulus polyphemus]XP_022254940.1 guanine nucleotide exchange factor MSS4-like isoform X2 [Limulus polyphemus]XP_022254941.1 guanine nucleotide exchange factor MSS4-like isoform X2 [Limulus polyphemus]
MEKETCQKQKVSEGKACEETDIGRIPDMLKETLTSSKNESTVMCQKCPSIILKPGLASTTNIEQFLPFMYQETASTTPDGETVKQFWCVDDIYSFENVGFSSTVGQIKYLTCADCEIGPIGWHDLLTKKSYIAPNRVKL